MRRPMWKPITEPLTLTQAASIALVIILAVAVYIGVSRFFDEIERRINKL